MQLPKLSVQLLQTAVGGPKQLLHVAQVAAVCGHPPQVLHTFLDFQLLLDGSAGGGDTIPSWVPQLGFGGMEAENRWAPPRWGPSRVH